MPNLETAKAQYERILLETMNNQNLEKNFKDVEESIAEVEKLIKENEEQGKPAAGYTSIKNELYYLKFQILERS